MKKKLLVSFSGGETSAFMAKWLKDNKSNEYEMVFVFANTGEENEATLVFADKCDKAFGLNLVWIEYDHLSFCMVNFESASRNGQPFEKMIQKFGIPNVGFNHCSRELKQAIIKRFARSIGWMAKDYDTAIGIRADEIDRISKDRKKNRLIYPLVNLGITKPKINLFWRQMPFRLELKGYEGNCKVCWKKSLRKHLTIMKESPQHFNNFEKWEEKYKNSYQKDRPESNQDIRFFRSNLTVNDIRKLSQADFIPAKDDSTIYSYQEKLFGFDLDVSNGCVESCEVF
jgi:hypothetical protein